MAGKAAVLPLVVNHINTLRDSRTDRIRSRDIGTHYFLPLAVAAALPFGLDLRLADAGQVIAGASILAGFSFGFAIWVFELRLHATRDPRVPKGAYLLDLLDELFTNVCYTIVVGLALVVLAVGATSLTSSYEAARVFSDGWTFALLALGLHYVVTLLMCLKRIVRAYRELTI